MYFFKNKGLLCLSRKIWFWISYSYVCIIKAMLLTTRLILLQVYQKWDETAINCSQRDFSKTKWKGERRYSPSDINASIFIPLKQIAEWVTGNGESSLSDLWGTWTFKQRERERTNVWEIGSANELLLRAILSHLHPAHKSTARRTRCSLSPVPLESMAQNIYS